MKKILFSPALFLSVLCFAQYNGSYEGLYDSERSSALRKHVEYVASVAMEGRKAGSSGEKETAGYVFDVLKDYGVDMLCPREGDVFGISQDGRDTLISRNVFGFVQGYDKNLRNRYIVIGARMDNLGTGSVTVDGNKVETIYRGANGNASGVAMMLELAKMVSTNSVLFRRSVIFVGFGASSCTFAGSYNWLHNTFATDADKIDLMINLDMLGVDDKETFYVYSSSNNDVNGLVSEFSSGLQPVKPRITAQEPYPSDHLVFYDAGIPSVLFTTGRYAQHNTAKDTPSIISYGFMERELEFIYNAALGFANTSRTISFRGDQAPKAEKKTEDVYPYYDCDIKPSFLGNTDPRFFLKNWVYQYLKYPQAAVEKGIQGTVQVSFVIDKSGEVKDAAVTKSVHQLLDEEALRVVKASPKWRPARVRGEKVSSSMTLSIEFRLDSKGSKKKVSFNGL